MEAPRRREISAADPEVREEPGLWPPRWGPRPSVLAWERASLREGGQLGGGGGEKVLVGWEG